MSSCTSAKLTPFLEIFDVDETSFDVNKSHLTNYHSMDIDLSIKLDHVKLGKQELNLCVSDD